MKVTGKVENIFAHAVALDQNGGLRNTIFGLGDEVYIMNYDHTILLRFPLPKSAMKFDPPISFKANDYDSDEFEQEGDKIIFTSEKNGYLRKKTCGVAELTPQQVRDLFKEYTDEDEAERHTISINKGMLELLDHNLSHVEFIAEPGEEIRMIQRNIYSGGIIEVKKKGGLMDDESTDYKIGPVAIKTGDFAALFAFTEIVNFSFPVEGAEDYILIKAMKSNVPFDGVVACCLYDEIIEIKNSKHHGREKQKIRRSK